MKKLLSVLLSLAFVLGCVISVPEVSAAEIDEQEFIYYEGNDGIYIRGYHGEPSGEFVVPSVIDDLPVVGIDSKTFKDCAEITSVVLPETLVYMGWSVFEGCTNLESVYVPGNTEIGARCFLNCVKLATIELNENIGFVDYNAFHNTAFYNDSENWEDGLLYISKCLYDAVDDISGYITVKDGTKFIADSIFEGSGIIGVSIPDSVTAIGSNAFLACDELTRVDITDLSAWCRIEFGDSNGNPLVGQSYVGGDFYVNNEKITNLVIPSDITAVGAYNFSGGNFKTVSIPEGVTDIGNSAFAYCRKLERVSIPSSVKSIGERAFWGNGMLSSIDIPEGVESIGMYAFDGTDISDLNIPESVTNIGIGIIQSTPCYYNEANWEGDVEDGILYIDGCLLGAYNVSGDCVVREGTRIIADSAFECLNIDEENELTGIVIPEGVTHIGTDAFYRCRNLKTVIFPQSLQSIGDSAFMDCELLENFTLHENLKHMGQEVFVGCSSLTEATIPDSVLYLGGGCFFGCENLEKLTVPFMDETRVSIGNYNGLAHLIGGAFTSNPGRYPDTPIKTLIISDVCDIIYSDSLSYYDTLETVIIGDGVYHIGVSAFEGCENLKEVVLGKNLKYISADAFEDCVSLENITIPEKVTYIGTRAFLSCTALESIVIPDSVTTLERAAFSNCKNLKDVTIGSGLTTLAERVFSDCVSITEIVIPDTVTHIEEGVFIGCEQIESITLPFIGEYADGSGATHLGHIFGLGNSQHSPEEDEDLDVDDEIIIPNPTPTVPVSPSTRPNSSTVMPKPDDMPLEDAYGIKIYKNLKTLVVTDVCTVIPEKSLLNFVGLENIVLGKNIVSIGKNVFNDTAFYKNTNNWENGALYIGEYLTCFCGVGIDKPDIKNGTKVVADYTFSGAQITDVIIPNSVTNIGVAAFKDCTTLQNVWYEGSEAEIENLVVASEYNESLKNAVWHLETCDNDTHEYTADCDISCENCEWVRTASADHTYDNGEDMECNNCGFVREEEVPVLNGWVDVDGIWHFYENGTMVTNEWRKDSIGWCYLLEDGRMATNMWLQDSKGWCYIEADGYCATNCWKQDSIGWIWLDSEGSMTKNQWILDGGKWYYLNDEGYMAVNCWMADSVGWVYVGSDGAMLTNEWVMDSVGWCYVGADGYAMTNCWMADSIGWCYLDAEGRMVTNDWVPDSNGECYINANGYWDGTRR